MLHRFIFTLFLVSSLSFGASPQAKQIKALYKCLAKDFVIYEFIKQKSTTKEDAKYLYHELYRPTYRLKKLFYKKIHDRDFVYHDRCKTCKYLGIGPKGFYKLSKKKKKLKYAKIKKIHKKRVLWMEAMMAKDTFKTLSHGNGNDFLKLFFSLGQNYRKKVLDKTLPSKFLTRLANQKRFYRFVMKVAMSDKYKNLPSSLLRVNPLRAKMDFNTAFYLGLIAIKKDDTKKAMSYFKRAIQQTTKKIEKNKATFWLYLASKDEKFLHELTKSTDLNIYSYYAREKLKKPLFEIITPKPNKQTLKDFNTTDPFLWAKTFHDFNDANKTQKLSMIQNFYTKQTLPQYSYLKERFSGYKKYYFINPYDDLLKKQSTQRKILINSLARQESRFIPASISTSYALGFMQFMPFLIDDTAKENGIKNFKYFDIFKPKNALHFANIHLDYLSKYLHSPLFIAYAYNGGIGFTRSLFNKRGLFKKGKYEPFLSMELVHYKESRKYGKKVLLNYVIYSKLYGVKNVSLKKMLNDITNLEKSKAYKK